MGFPARAGINMTGNDKVDKLIKQLESIFHSSNAGWKKSRRVRFHQFKLFLKFVGTKFKLDDIGFIRPTQVRAFVEWRRENRIRENTILTDISTIRFWHKQIPLRRYNLPSNELILGDGDLRDRTWKR
ncbi:hypothetical protein [Desulfoscipio gibsoniae]|uniref:Core-binding (CB) domain-containing protein n=1 Tax=Desulfoscipio gibsoniae DSM 7213 TaxID=767817 RepID=R4KEE4_9FIRM|nr:hypothetical protein [Desulfoscipio gibsoniae]AGL00964.1 hypothetical protein Desgi_1474 [Desulfoscipio gibsoniae DSM 7213]